MKNALIAALVAALVATTLSSAGDFQPTPIAKPSPTVLALQHRVDHLADLEARHNRQQNKRLNAVEANVEYDAASLEYLAGCFIDPIHVTFLGQDGELILVAADDSVDPDYAFDVPSIDPDCFQAEQEAP